MQLESPHGICFHTKHTEYCTRLRSMQVKEEDHGNVGNELRNKQLVKKLYGQNKETSVYINIASQSRGQGGLERATVALAHKGVYSLASFSCWHVSDITRRSISDACRQRKLATKHMGESSIPLGKDKGRLEKHILVNGAEGKIGLKMQLEKHILASPNQLPHKYGRGDFFFYFFI